MMNIRDDLQRSREASLEGAQINKQRRSRSRSCSRSLNIDQNNDQSHVVDPKFVCGGGNAMFNQAFCATTRDKENSINENDNHVDDLEEGWLALQNEVVDSPIDSKLLGAADKSFSSSVSSHDNKTPCIPVRPTAPVPIPIQHCTGSSGLQRPALQYSTNNGNSLEENKSGDYENEGLRNNRPRSIRQLIAAIRQGQQGQQANNNDLSVKRRLEDFGRARWLRRDASGKVTPPCGIFGLFEHLSGIRADLNWAEYVAYQRSHCEPYVSWTDYMKEHERHYHGRPFFIIFVNLISAIMMVYVMYLSNWTFAPLHENPMLGPSGEVLLQAGALDTYLIVVEGEWYRLFVPLVLHAGIIHLVLNMLAIWFIGSALEKIHGFTNISCLFIISAVGGNILSAAIQPNVISVGASGGIFGLIGICLADIFVNWDLLFLKIGNVEQRTPWDNAKVLFWLIFDMIVNVVIGLTPYIDNFAHMGGLLYGIFYALPLAERLGLHFFGHRGFFFKVKNCILRLFGYLAGCSLIIVSSVLLMKSDGYNSPCEKCRFISCAPFPFWKEEKWWDCSLE